MAKPTKKTTKQVKTTKKAVVKKTVAKKTVERIQTTVRLTVPLRKKVDGLAKKLGKTVNDVLYQFVIDGLKKA